ncbi:MAG TPA: hypothetical protein VF054_03015 [Micromonosporaceae bacterium]
MLDPTARPQVRLVPLVRFLAEREIEWVLTGSTVLALHGGRLVPNDLDVAPRLDGDNLQRLAEALDDLDAVPAFVPEWGDMSGPEECRSWTPRPATEQNLDHMYVTRLGMVDVVPRICGRYDELVEHATTVDIAGVPVAVCALSAVLDRLRGRGRAKDVQRAAIYADLEQRSTAGPTPDALGWLLDQLPG